MSREEIFDQEHSNNAPKLKQSNFLGASTSIDDGSKRSASANEASKAVASTSSGISSLNARQGNTSQIKVESQDVLETQQAKLNGVGTPDSSDNYLEEAKKNLRSVNVNNHDLKARSLKNDADNNLEEARRNLKDVSVDNNLAAFRRNLKDVSADNNLAAARRNLKDVSADNELVAARKNLKNVTATNELAAAKKNLKKVSTNNDLEEAKKSLKDVSADNELVAARRNLKKVSADNNLGEVNRNSNVINNNISDRRQLSNSAPELRQNNSLGASTGIDDGSQRSASANDITEAIKTLSRKGWKSSGVSAASSSISLDNQDKEGIVEIAAALRGVSGGNELPDKLSGSLSPLNSPGTKSSGDKFKQM